MLDELLKLLQDLEDPNCEDTPLFAQLVDRTMTLVPLDDQQLGRIFSISFPSVRNWRAGITSPHPKMRPHVYRELRHTVKKAIERLSCEHEFDMDGSPVPIPGTVERCAKCGTTREILQKQSGNVPQIVPPSETKS